MAGGAVAGRRKRRGCCGCANGATSLTPQIPADRHRHHYVKAKVRVHRYVDRSLAIFHGPRKLAHYDAAGRLMTEQSQQAASRVRQARRLATQ
jgi:hypothetical protein